MGPCHVCHSDSVTKYFSLSSSCLNMPKTTVGLFLVVPYSSASVGNLEGHLICHLQPLKAAAQTEAVNFRLSAPFGAALPYYVRTVDTQLEA